MGQTNFALRYRSLVIKSVLLTASLLLVASFSFAQNVQRCATVEVEKQRRLRLPGLETEAQFESWMQKKLAQRKSAGTLTNGRTEDLTYTIPVVVHVIYNVGDEVVGVGTNISADQVQSQLDVMNLDYPRMNADAVNTPAEFAAVAGSININFVLAKQDPNGLPTNGITRTASQKAAGYNELDNVEFKSLSYWPSEDYFNIWVLDLKDSDPAYILFGYAQLPYSPTLQGLGSATQNAVTDGIAINYLAFGKGAGYKLYTYSSQGRTATHEAGHFFGLRHIWGDVGTVEHPDCGGTDYCDDTPTQDYSSSNCMTQPFVSCGHDRMFQNYMDYSSDGCMNLFTADQVSRMVTVLGESPRRLSLLSSHALQDPVHVANDLGTKQVIIPDVTACAGVPIDPVVQLINTGNNQATSASVQLTVNGTVVETKDFSVNMAYLDTAYFTFSPVTLPDATTNTLTFTIINVNGVADGQGANNAISQTVVTTAKIPLPIAEPFNSKPTTWAISNPDNSTTWTIITAPYSSSTNKAMYMNFYDYEYVDKKDKLITPVFDLSTGTTATLKFDWSYAPYSATTNADQLIVSVSTSCDTNDTTIVFNAAGAALGTTGATKSSFTPRSAADWKTITISLDKFLGQPDVQVSFIAINQNGNNLYLDNVSITNGAFTDLALNGLVTPSPVTCTDVPVPVVNVSNVGSTLITALSITAVVNGSSQTTNITGLNLAVNDDMDITLPSWGLTAGTNPITITATPTGLTDLATANNSLNLNVELNTSKDVIPLRQNFNGDYTSWSLASPMHQATWIPQATNNTSKGVSMAFDAYSNPAFGSQAWLASPVLDFSKATKASIFFDLSYAISTTNAGRERLQIFASTDCGNTFTSTLFDKSGDSLAIDIPLKGYVNASSSSWNPQQNGDWARKYVNLDALAGLKNVRLAFVVTNQQGNNLYLDNIEMYTDDNTAPLAVTPLYAVYNNTTPNVKITFDLPSKEDVRIQVYNTLGMLIVDTTVEDVLNQTFDLDLNGRSTGIYIVRLQMGTTLGIAKVFLGQ